MMAKEKAEEFKEKFTTTKDALIAVDEIMKTIFHQPSKGKFWQEVRKEIENL